MHADPSFDLLIDTTINGEHYAVALVHGELQERSLVSLTDGELASLREDLLWEQMERDGVPDDDGPRDSYGRRLMRPLDLDAA